MCYNEKGKVAIQENNKRSHDLDGGGYEEKPLQ